MSAWQFDVSHTVFGFSVRHLVVGRVSGRFRRFEGSFEVDPAMPQNARAVVTIDAASVDTIDEKRDGHLRSADFFDVENHPKITFESSRVDAAPGGHYTLHGRLTIRGITHDVTLDVESLGVMTDPWGGVHAVFTVVGTLERERWGLKWNQPLSAGGMLVSDRVGLAIEVQLSPKT